MCEVEELCGVNDREKGMSRSSALHGVNSLSLLTYTLDSNSLSQHSGEPAVVEQNEQENSRIQAEHEHTQTTTHTHKHKNTNKKKKKNRPHLTE